MPTQAPELHERVAALAEDDSLFLALFLDLEVLTGDLYGCGPHLLVRVASKSPSSRRPVSRRTGLAGVRATTQNVEISIAKRMSTSDRQHRRAASLHRRTFV